MKYKPSPINTSKVKLSRKLRDSIEKLSENYHDQWALMRMSEGWTLGRSRSDKKKTHPDLIPYKSLPESEKDFNRNASTEALKAVIALGYKIESESRKVSAASVLSSKAIDEAKKRLSSSENLSLTTLISIWSLLSSGRQTVAAHTYDLLGNRILKKGEPLLAYDVISVGLDNYPNNVRLMQLLGLALAESGATDKANTLLAKLKGQGMVDGETLGILARTHKDLWASENDTAQLGKAHELYCEGFSKAKSSKKKGWADDAIYTGINAASTALLMGKERRAKILALEIRELCLKKLKRRTDYWTLATLGEAAVILRNWKEAEERYSQANEFEQGNYRANSSTRRQARALLNHFNEDKHRFDQCFGIPRIVVFSGHMIDQPGRPSPRFPKSLENSVRKEIAEKLKNLDAGFGYSSAACGSDILFLEEMLKRRKKFAAVNKDIEVNIILPIPEDKFQNASVDIIPDSDWVRRYKRTLKQATRVIVATKHQQSENPTAFLYTNMLLDGLATIRAKTMDTDVIPLVVWDGQLGDGMGGTQSIVNHWRSHGVEPEIVDITELRRDAIIVKAKPTATKKKVIRAASQKRPEFSQEIRAMLFADVVGYSKLFEDEIPYFIQHFMTPVAKLTEKYRDEVLMKNTWGDALYFVFSSIKGAGNFALDLRDWIAGADWESKGLPKHMSLRIALHAGPVFLCKDPVLDKYVYTGTHVSRAARIEPITPPGYVYASQEFAALASSLRIKDFSLDYAGQITLPKEYGTVALFHLQRG